MNIKKFAEGLGVESITEFDSRILVPEERIRAFCSSNKCGSYNLNHMCPPRIGSIEKIRKELGQFSRGLLLQYTKSVDVKGDREGVDRIKVDFHHKILQIEGFLRGEGIKEMWGMSGGSCGLCTICEAALDKPCPYPDKARTSLEAIAIDVLDLRRRFGLDDKFHDDRVTWTGCVLF